MEKIKALILYKDWLLLNRGEVRPEVGDKICIQSEYEYQEWQYWTVSSVNNNSAFLKYGNCENEIDISLFYVEIDYNPKPNLEGLLKDGYTFICTEHGLYSNCDCQDNQIKVWSDEKVDELKDDFRNITNIHFDSLCSKLAIEFADWIDDNNFFKSDEMCNHIIKHLLKVI